MEGFSTRNRTAHFATDVVTREVIRGKLLAVADEMRLVVMLHVPGSDRLAHPRTQAEVG